jgi:hypothetical protein
MAMGGVASCGLVRGVAAPERDAAGRGVVESVCETGRGRWRMTTNPDMLPAALLLVAEGLVLLTALLVARGVKWLVDRVRWVKWFNRMV